MPLSTENEIPCIYVKHVFLFNQSSSGDIVLGWATLNSVYTYMTKEHGGIILKAWLHIIKMGFEIVLFFSNQILMKWLLSEKKVLNKIKLSGVKQWHFFIDSCLWLFVSLFISLFCFLKSTGRASVHTGVPYILLQSLSVI